MNKGILETILELRETVRRHDELFDQNKEVISDSEYDEIYRQLEALELAHAEFYDVNSPTQKVVTTVVKGLKKVKHTIPMLSQDKVHTAEEIRKFCRKGDISKGIIISLKLDGLTVVIKFNNGKVSICISRGSGSVGEVITHTVTHAINLPKRIPFKGDLEIRGEAIISFKEFERIINELLEQDVAEEDLPKTPRNLASGTVRSLNGKVAKDRGVQFIAFDTISAEGMDFQLDTERLEFIKEQGIEVVPYEVFYNEDDVVNYCLTFADKFRKSLPYPIDGLVLTFNDLSIREELGFTNKFPRWGCAFKFKDEVVETTLNEVKWTVGKTGQITPVGYFTPVVLDGTDVEKASLANMDNIKERGILLHSRVKVQKANMIIPQIVSVVEGYLTGKEEEIIAPDKCPVCGAPVHNDGVTYFCRNELCSAQFEAKFKHMVSSDALNINGLGKKTCEAFIEAGLITSLDQLFDLKDKVEQIAMIEGLGMKTAQKIIESIEEAKKLPLSTVLYSLAIPNVGRDKTKLIASHYPSISILLEKVDQGESFINELTQLPDVGEVISNSLYSFLRDNRDFMEILIDKGLQMEEPVQEVNSTNGNISGKTFVITGNVFKFKNRKELKDKIVAMNGKVAGSVSSKTDYLINNESQSASSKNVEAQKLGIRIITEDEFLSMIE